jgi:hypothetical protein
MRTYLLLTACLTLIGCGRRAENNREVLGELEAIKSELANRKGAPVRWAFANKHEIESVVFQWSRDKMEKAKASEALSPEVEEKIRQHEALQTELMQKRMEAMRLRFPPRASAAEAPATDKEYETLAGKVAEAKAPVAAIVERRNRQAAQYREDYSIDRLIAEYVRDRFDLVVDSNEKVLFRSAGEVPDITEGIITFFKEKTKP